MKNALLTFFAVAASAGLALAQGPSVNTPNTPVECVPTLITWSGGQAPYTLLIQEPDANGTPVQQYPGLTSTSFSWSTNITAGTSIGFTVRDATGAPGQTAPVTIVAGTTDSCIAGSPDFSSTSAASDSSTSAPSSGSSTSSVTSPASTPSGASTSSTGSSTASHPSSSGSGSSTSSGASPSNTGGSSNNNGAMANAAGLGAVGFIGAVVAAIMA